MSEFTAVYVAAAKVQDPAKILLVPHTVSITELHPSCVASLPSTIEVDTASPQYEALNDAYGNGGLQACRLSLVLQLNEEGENAGKWTPKAAEVL